MRNRENSEAEIRAAIETADRVLAGAPAQEPPHAGHVNPVPAATGAEPTEAQVAEWSKQLGFAPTAKKGRVTRAND